MAPFSADGPPPQQDRRVSAHIRLIASDIDGTLLRSDHTVSDRTRAAVAAAQDAGVPVVLISGRQAPVLAPIAAEAGLSGPAICANGAVGYHLGRQEVLFEELLAVEAQTELLHAVRAVYPASAACPCARRGSSSSPNAVTPA